VEIGSRFAKQPRSGLTLTRLERPTLGAGCSEERSDRAAPCHVANGQSPLRGLRQLGWFWF